jgi:hypothetical protein
MSCISESMDAQLENARRDLLALVRQPKKRSSEFLEDLPTVFQPQKVSNPATPGDPFTPRGAWAFIEEKLENGHELVRGPSEMKQAYVMHVDLELGKPRLYIKLQLTRGKVWCRSFHYDRQSGSL